MKRLFVLMAGAAVFLLTLIATAGAASASNYVLYEPKVPAKLRK